ncbi:carboxymuconolactone decarboxylase family protein [Streptomyces sp. NPDC093598]|uniref:carboxymuconolactone decarboxylase family protein n=1 Tax=Streptomyces sp. NPDC093598 TaxID=3366046 RepID=UPI003811DD12
MPLRRRPQDPSRPDRLTTPGLSLAERSPVSWRESLGDWRPPCHSATKRLPGELRELLILRTAWNTGARYEWGRHLPLARAAGVTDADVDRVSAGPEAPGWTDLRRHLIRAADELHGDATMSDATWARPAEHFGDAELIEIAMLVGQYHMLAFFLNATGVELEPGFDSTGFAEGERNDR